MKYSIVINQRVVAELNDGTEDKSKRLDLVDCALLDWLVAICSSRSEAVVKERRDGLTWVSYDALMKDMPLLGITSKANISRRIVALADNGFLRKKIIGQRVYVDFTVKTERLTYDPDASMSQKPLRQRNGKPKTVASTQRNRCASATDHNTNINNKKTKIHERERKVKDNLGISGRVRFLATRDFMERGKDGQPFEAWFNENRAKYQNAGG